VRKSQKFQGRGYAKFGGDPLTAVKVKVPPVATRAHQAGTSQSIPVSIAMAHKGVT